MVRLSKRAEDIVKSKMERGRFPSEEAVIEAALVRLQQDDEEEQWSGQQLEKIKELVDEGMRSIEEEGTVDGAPLMTAFLEETRAKYGKKR